MEVCKREGSDPEEKGVDRLLGLGSSRCGAGVLLRGGVSENARVQLLGTQPCQLPRCKVVTRNGGLGRAGGGVSHSGGCLTPVPAVAPQAEWYCLEKTRRRLSWGSRCSR